MFEDKNTVFILPLIVLCVVILANTVEIAFVCIYKFIFFVHSIVIICNLNCNLTFDKTNPKIFFLQLVTIIPSFPVLSEDDMTLIIECAFIHIHVHQYHALNLQTVSSSYLSVLNTR